VILAFLKKFTLNMEALITFSLLFLIEASVAYPLANFPQDENIIQLEKIGEICIPDKMECFLKITGICVDKNDNLYVADSGRNKIYKFNPYGDLQKSFGEFGQGPGEFLGNTYNCFLEISYGNDGNLYIVDSCNKKISVFSTNGNLLKSFNLGYTLYDTAAVNSKGEIYILSNSGLKALECRDLNFRFKEYLFEYDNHIQFPHGDPFVIGERLPIPYEYRYPNKLEIIKLMMKNDRLAVFSNYSWKVMIFDAGNKVINQFSIDENEVIKDFKKQLTDMKVFYKKYSIERKRKTSNITVYASPFKMFSTCNNDLYFVYKNSKHYSYIYRYRSDGTLTHRYLFPEIIHGNSFCCNRNTKIFTTLNNGTGIGIFR